MKTRKIVLLATCAVLLAVCIIQGITGSIDPVKTIRMTETPDRITVSSSVSSIEMVSKGADWSLNNDGFNVDRNSFNAMIAHLREIKVLDTAGRISNDEANAKYDLNDSKAIVVHAYKAEKEIASLRIGKVSSTGAQTFVCINGSKDISLVSGNLLTAFGKTEEELKSKLIYSILPENVATCEISMNGSSLGFEKTGNEDGKLTWKFTGNSLNKEADSEKINSYLNQATVCSASEWISDSETLPSKKTGSLKFAGTDGLTIIEIFEEKGSEKTRYVCSSNKTSHRFEITESTKNKLLKNLTELAK